MVARWESEAVVSEVERCAVSGVRCIGHYSCPVVNMNFLVSDCADLADIVT